MLNKIHQLGSSFTICHGILWTFVIPAVVSAKTYFNIDCDTLSVTGKMKKPDATTASGYGYISQEISSFLAEAEKGAFTVCDSRFEKRALNKLSKHMSPEEP